MQSRPLLEKASLWRQDRIGLKTQRQTLPSIRKRDDISQSALEVKLNRAEGLPSRGEAAQKARLKWYPSIDVDRDGLFAGRIEGDIADAREKLFELGYRNNPTAYVEVTEENGPDDGSYARQYVTETSTRRDRQYLSNHPSFLRRVKNQVHVCIWKVGDYVEFLAHDEKSAWLQPMLHLEIPDVNARIGVRDFRDDWFDEFGEELPGKEEVNWETTH